MEAESVAVTLVLVPELATEHVIVNCELAVSSLVDVVE
jgi:hypothetical protein